MTVIDIKSCRKKDCVHNVTGMCERKDIRHAVIYVDGMEILACGDYRRKPVAG